MLVPPLARINLYPIHLHTEVKMIPARQARCAAPAHFLALLHRLAGLETNQT